MQNHITNPEPSRARALLPAHRCAERIVDCFWCGGLLFRSRELLVCPDCAATFEAAAYIAPTTTAGASR